MPKLTERRHLETRSAIADAAIALFVDRGFGETTMSDVADAAQVSRRTVYRHFPTKDDLVFEHPRQWHEQLETIFGQREADESMHDLTIRALLSIAQSIDEHKDQVLAAFSVLQANESLRGTHARSDDLWVQGLVTAFLGELADAEAMALPVLLLASSLVAATNSAIAIWSATQPGSNIEQITTAALDQIDPLWPDALR